MSLRPVVLDLGVLALASLLHFRAFFVPMYQIRTEQIEFVIQSDELAPARVNDFETGGACQRL